jgi:PAS domain S-box-containing protein
MARGDDIDLGVQEIVDHTLVEVATRPSLPADEIEQALKRYDRVVQGRAVLKQEVASPTPGGKRRGHVRLAPVLDAEGRSQHVVCTTRESMDRLRALLMMLDQGEARVARAFRSTPAPMPISRLSDDRFIDVNDACCRLWGYARDEFIGNAAAQMNLRHAPADRQRFVEKVHATGSVRDLDIVIGAIDIVIHRGEETRVSVYLSLHEGVAVARDYRGHRVVGRARPACSVGR